MKINPKIFSDYDRQRIQTKYEEILDLIEYILIDTTSHLKMFGYFYMSLSKKLVFVDNIEFYKEIKNLDTGLVFIEDKTIIFVIDPDILFDDNAVFKILNKVIHQLLHCMLKHNSRKPEDITDAVIFNLAADHVVNCIMKQLHDNVELTKLGYFSKDEFIIERLISKPVSESVDKIFEYINTSDEFMISAKRITIPIDTNSDDVNMNQILIEDVIKISDVNKLYDNVIKDKKLSLLNPFDSEFNTSKYTFKENKPIDDELYIQKSHQSFFEKINSAINQSDSSNLIDTMNKIDNPIDDDLTDDMNSMDLKFVDSISFIIIHVYDKITKKSRHVIYDLENQSLGSQMIERDAQSQYQKYKNEMRKAMGRKPGSTTADMMSVFDDIFTVDYPWDEVLENAIKVKSQISDERSYTAYDIYRSHISKVRFPGCLNELIPDVLCGVIDSSGSMTDDELKQIISILCDSVGKYSKIIVIVHDVLVKDIIYIEEGFSKDTIFNKLKEVKGRGGTSHIDVFEKIQELTESYIFSTLIFFTDFESDVQIHCTNFPVLNSLESIWCIFGKDKSFKIDLPIPTKTIVVHDKMFK